MDEVCARYGISDIKTFNSQKLESDPLAYFTEWNSILLNLSYITDGIYLMCQPSVKDVIKRNDIRIIHDYIVEQCGNDNYYIINLHLDNYDKRVFDNRVLYIPFPDHCAPRIEYFINVSKEMDRIRRENNNCKLFIHCKAGRGRSGTVYCAYEIFNGKMNYIEAIDIVNRLRSPKNMCITIPSQKRFLQYFQYFCKCGKPERKSILIKKIEFIPGLGRKTNLVIIKGIPYEDKPFYKKEFDGNVITFNNDEIIVEEEFVIDLIDDGAELNCVNCQINTDYLIPELHDIQTVDDMLVVHFNKDELDGPHHRSKGKNFPDGFSMNIYYINK